MAGSEFLEQVSNTQKGLDLFIQLPSAHENGFSSLGKVEKQAAVHALFLKNNSIANSMRQMQGSVPAMDLLRYTQEHFAGTVGVTNPDYDALWEKGVNFYNQVLSLISSRPQV